MTIDELDKLIQILYRRCKIQIIKDRAMDYMNYKEWLEDVIKELESKK
jgi:hypothetical protein